MNLALNVKWACRHHEIQKYYVIPQKSHVHSEIIMMLIITELIPTHKSGLYNI